MAHRLHRGLRLNFFFIMAVLLFVCAAALLHCVVVSAAAAKVHHRSAENVPAGTDAEYYLRGKTVRFSSMQNVAASEEGRQAQLQRRFDAFWQPSRQLSEEETSSSEADSVAVEDYTPCANDKHDPSVCQHH